MCDGIKFIKELEKANRKWKEDNFYHESYFMTKLILIVIEIDILH